MRSQQVAQITDQLGLIGSVDIAEHVVGHYLNTGETEREEPCDFGEKFFASEQVIPYERDARTDEPVTPRSERP